MDRRTVLALVLVAAVILLTPRLFPTRPAVVPPKPDSAATAAPSRPESATPAAVSTGQQRAVADSARPAEQITADTVVVADSAAVYRFVNRGAVIAGVELAGFRALGAHQGSVALTASASPLIRFMAMAGRDTVRFDTVAFTVTRGATTGHVTSLAFSGGVGLDSLHVDYTIVADSFLVHVSGRVGGRLATAPSYLLVDLAPTLNSFEADTVDDVRRLSFAVEAQNKGARGIGFGSLDPGERAVLPGPHAWAALKNKYFILGVLARDSVSPIVEFSATGLPRTSRAASHAQGTAIIQPVQGAFALDVYAGPQQWKRLTTLGRGFENSNPYGGFLQPVVQPFAVMVMRVLLWMRGTLNISYGWVLVIFGIAVRLILWPLNQSAMRTSIKMQRIQPELNELQKRHKSDPQKLQSEMMRVYKEHGMSPFSMFSGCLPLLLPMPVLFALFFVFQSTIEFRGVSFIWLADISQKDPFYLLPIIMGISMFVLSWIGTRNAPPNPQTKVMLYVFPVMMTFLLANLAAGLNLYYAVQNVAALPQQWLIANERARAAKPKT